jgi:cytochrome P450
MGVVHDLEVLMSAADIDTSPTLADETGRYIEDVTAKRYPYELLHRLRNAEPVHRSAAGTWIISEIELATAALRDDRFGRDVAVVNEIGKMFSESSDATEVYRHKMMNQDGADHMRLRRLLAGTFSPGSVRNWRADIELTVDEVFDAAVPRRGGDLIREIAYPIPEHLVCHLLGVPFSDHDRFEEWFGVLNQRPQAGHHDDDRKAQATSALDALAAYVRGLVADRRVSPGSDLISTLVAIEEDGDRLKDVELLAVITEVINGGHDTTANSIANSVLMLFTFPDVFDELKADRSLVPAFVEEVLRYRSAVQSTLTRVAREDIEIAGVTIPAGDTVIVSLAGANRTESGFDHSEQFDIHRAENRHIAFGTGSHVCLGAHLARAELQVTIDRVVSRMPDLRLVGSLDELTWRTTNLVMAPAALPVTW